MRYKKALIIYTILFALLFGIAYVPFFLSGRTFVTKMDGIDQYFMGFFYFGKYLREAISSGIWPLYDLGIGMGEDILGSLNYYGFADPIYLISVLSDGQLAPFFFSFSFFIRIYLAGVAFLVYCRQMKLPAGWALVGVFCYIVNGFTYGGVTSYMGWGSVLIYMPLMLTAVERTFKKEGRAFLLMMLSSVYAALCGFYFLYMCCIFLILYCLSRGIAIYGLKSLSKVITCSLQAALPLVLGILMAGPVFFPSITGFMGSERSDISIGDILFNRENWTPYLPVYMSFLNEPAHYYFKYISKITWSEYIAVVMAFFLPKTRAKIQLCVANAVILLTVSLPVTGYIFSGFGESGFEVNTRWAFLIHFIFSVTLVYVLGAAWPKLLEKGAARRVITAVLIILVAVCTVNTVRKNVRSKGARLDTENISRNMDSPVLYSKVLAEDKSVYRVSLDRFMTTSDRPENTAMVRDYYGVTYWLSIMNNYTQLASDTICGQSQEWRSDGLGHIADYETAFGVKYYLGKGENPVPEGYEELESFDYYGETWRVYRNPGWVGLGYTRSGAAADGIRKDIFGDGDIDTKGCREYFGSVTRDIKAPERLEFDNRRGILSCDTGEGAGDELILAIPFSAGWQATVDGQKVQAAVKDLMCIAVNTGGGAHHVELRYKSAGFEAGCIAMILSVILTAGYFLILRFAGRLYRKENH